MAKGIQDIGVGFGYLYMTDVTGTQILATQPNTVSGVRNMRQQGTSTAPIVASRPAVGELRVLSVASIGSITNIDIYGINQIGANIAVTSSTTSVVAGQIAAAINAYTASPVNFTAQAINNIVYLFSPANAQPGYPNYNGAAITVSVTDPSIQTSTTPTTNGSTQFSNSYDDVFGFRFLLDADYGPAGVPGSQPATPTSTAYAIEITEYFTVRGMQSGIVTINSTIAADRLLNLNRTCAFTQIIVDTQASAATDVLAFIETIGFVEGDEIRLRNTNPSRVPVLEDATVSTSPIATKNIYLINQAPFSITGYLSINLQLRNDPSLGFIWVETGRSEVVNGVITRTISTMNADIVAGLVRPNGLYWITDIGPRGAYVQGLSATQISTTASMGRRVPKNVYNDTWRTNITGGVVVIGDYYRYYNSIYQSVTGVLGTAPPSAPDWTLTSGSSFYTTEQHTITLNLQDGVGIDPLWPYIEEKDSNNNVVRMSKDSFAALGVNEFNIFPWCETGAPQVRDNTIDNSVFDAYQFTRPGDVVAGNLITSSTVFNTNNPQDGTPCDLKNNIVTTGIITNNRFAAFNENTITSGTVDLNSATSAGVSFIQNSVNYSTIQTCEHISSAVFFINNCVLEGLSSISGCTLDTTGISQMVLLGNSTLGGTMVNGTYEKWTLTAASQVSVSISPVIAGGIFAENSFVSAAGNIIWLVGGAGGSPDNIRYNTFTGTFGLTFDSTNSILVANQFDACFVSNSAIIGTAIFSTFINAATTLTSAFAYEYNNIYVSALESNLTYQLDLSNPTIYAAGVLTIPDNAAFASTFVIVSTIPRTISSIVRANYQSNWPPQGAIAGLYPTPTFIIGGNIAPFATITITTAVRATALGNEIIGDAASYTLDCVTGSTGLPYASDSITIRQIPRVQPSGGSYMYMVTDYKQYL